MRKSDWMIVVAGIIFIVLWITLSVTLPKGEVRLYRSDYKGHTSSLPGIPVPSISETETKASESISSDTFITVGNYTFVPLNAQLSISYGYPIGLNVSLDGVRKLLRALDAFEKKHPELEIMSWSIERALSPRTSFIFGVWINHRSRQNRGDKDD